MRIPIDSEETAELVEMLLEMSDEETELFEQLYEATERIRAAGGTREEKDAKIDRVLSEDPALHDAFRALTGRESLSQRG